MFGLEKSQVKVIHKLALGRVEFLKITPKMGDESQTATLPAGKFGHRIVDLRRGRFACQFGGHIVLTRRQVAERLSVSISTINRLLIKGELRGVHVGRSVRISESEVETFLMRGGTSHEG